MALSSGYFVVVYAFEDGDCTFVPTLATTNKPALSNKTDETVTTTKKGPYVQSPEPPYHIYIVV